LENDDLAFSTRFDTPALGTDIDGNVVHLPGDEFPNEAPELSRDISPTTVGGADEISRLHRQPLDLVAVDHDTWYIRRRSSSRVPRLKHRVLVFELLNFETLKPLNFFSRPPIITVLQRHLLDKSYS
jgi:hypothetical protein